MCKKSAPAGKVLAKSVQSSEHNRRIQPQFGPGNNRHKLDNDAAREEFAMRRFHRDLRRLHPRRSHGVHVLYGAEDRGVVELDNFNLRRFSR